MKHQVSSLADQNDKTDEEAHRGFPHYRSPGHGDTAWMLMSAALVLLMTPGVAFFYGGMVRAKSVLNMIMMSVGAMGVVGVWGAVRLFHRVR